MCPFGGRHRIRAVDLGLDGKTALVTGASSGIGAATASMLANEGADVVVSYWHNAEGASRTVEHIQQGGRRAWMVRMDVADAASVAEGLAAVRDVVPGLDAVALCSGVNVITPFEELSAAEWDQVVRVNLN